jgi:asparaginyl-tRNA synthetase
MDDKNTIKTALGTFSKDKFRALVNVRSTALKAFRDILQQRGYTEVTTSSLVNIAGSCENPHASFTLNYYGKEAHLSQSAQLQLEALVIRLRKAFFTVNNSFREEDYDDPDAPGRRLSEFTLIEPEKPFEGLTPEQALQEIIKEEEIVIKFAIQKILEECYADIILLGGDIEYLQSVLKSSFNLITYDKAIEMLGLKFGDDLNIKEEQKILKNFNNVPTFVTHYPTKIKFFNMKRMANKEKVYSVDLLMPRLGETTGGAVREEDASQIKEYLRNSKVGSFLRAKGMNPETPFNEYFNLFNQEKPLLRGGFGIGFERFVGFLLNSNDILNTITETNIRP